MQTCVDATNVHSPNIQLAAGAAQGPRVTQTAVMSAVFFTLFEFWKAQLKGPAARKSHDRCALWLGPPLGFREMVESGGGQTVVHVNACLQSLSFPVINILLCSGSYCPC